MHLHTQPGSTTSKVNNSCGEFRIYFFHLCVRLLKDNRMLYLFGFAVRLRHTTDDDVAFYTQCCQPAKLVNMSGPFVDKRVLFIG